PLSIFLTHLAGEEHGNFRNMSTFATDVAKNRLPLVSFLEPRYYDRPGMKEFANDAHPPHHVGLADKLVQDVYNALAANPSLFARTLFIVTFDEHGGSYDHVIPPQLEHAASPELSHLGFRVPTIFISPSVPKRAVLRLDGVTTVNHHVPSGLDLT